MYYHKNVHKNIISITLRIILLNLVCNVVFLTWGDHVPIYIHSYIQIIVVIVLNNILLYMWFDITLVSGRQLNYMTFSDPQIPIHIQYDKITVNHYEQKFNRNVNTSVLCLDISSTYGKTPAYRISTKNYRIVRLIHESQSQYQAS